MVDRDTDSLDRIQLLRQLEERIQSLETIIVDLTAKYKKLLPIAKEIEDYYRGTNPKYQNDKINEIRVEINDLKSALRDWTRD